MIEIPSILFVLISEGFIALLIVLLIWSFMSFQRKNKDRKAVKKLVEQIRHQSKTRLEHTGSFLNEKYRFEGSELEKAVNSIDRAEKKFIQTVVNIYLKRDASKLESMDAYVAELIEAYKSLSPVMPDAETLAALESGTEEGSEELESLRENNAKLTEELRITKETMGNMIAEFGNMFGGGKEHELNNEEVIDKVNVSNDDSGAAKEPETESSSTESEPDADTAKEEALNETDANKPQEKTKTSDSIDLDEGIEDLVDGIDLSE